MTDEHITHDDIDIGEVLNAMENPEMQEEKQAERKKEAARILRKELAQLEGEENEQQKAKRIYKEAGYISQHFQREDIKQRGEERGIELSEEQITDIASLLENMDCNTGIDWETIDIMTDEAINP